MKLYAKTKSERIVEAKKALARYENIKEEKRRITGKLYNAVNVKRYHDTIRDIETLAKEVSEKYADKLIAWYDGGEGKNFSGSDGIYDLWISDAWDQLNYEVSDAVNLGRKEKDYQYLKKTGNFIFSDGRMGGWACFDDIVGGYCDDLETAIFDYEDIQSSENAKYVKIYTDEVNAGCDEIDELKAFIKQFNADLSWREEVRFHFEEKISEYKEEDETKEKEKSARETILCLEDQNGNGIFQEDEKGNVIYEKISSGKIEKFVITVTLQ